MKNTMKAIALTAAIALMTPTFAYASPDSRSEWRDFGNNPLVRVVKTIRRFIVRALDGPMFPPPTPDQSGQ